ncbi:MAG: radical SAM protein [Magnetococcales bacterium]|nr:radical SAM protein [Magnetococcales bacterium]
MSNNTASPEGGGIDFRFLQHCLQMKQRYVKNNRLLLVQIPQFHIPTFNRPIARRRGYHIFPPTGLQYLYESIKSRPLTVEILDLNYEILKRVAEEEDFHPQQWKQVFQQRLQRLKPAMIGISCLYDSGLLLLREVLAVARQEADALVLCGGVAPAYEADQLLKNGLAHFVIAGEGENKLNYLLDCVSDFSQQTPATPGIHFLTADGESIQSQGKPDRVQIPGSLKQSYELVPIESYVRYGSLNPFSRSGDSHPRPFAVLQMSRGCRAECTFCAVRDIMGKGIRYRSVEHTLAEILFLYEQRGIRHFEWLDDDLLFRKREFQGLLQEIIHRKLDLTWSANNGLIATSLDENLLKLMNDSGCIGFKVGIETGNREMFRRVKKPGTHGNFLHLSKMLESFPAIFVGGNIIIGLPEESFLCMMDSFRFALQVRLDWIAFTVCQTIRGASAFSEQGEMLEGGAKKPVENFIPTRTAVSGHLTTDSGTVSSLDLFKLAADLVPTANQTKEIWFAFNLIVNFIYNKNLDPGGQPEKFIAWVETARKAYPSNPYMLLFLSLANRLLGANPAADQLQKEAIENRDDEYWRGRFKTYHLEDIIENPPKTRQDVFLLLQRIRQKISPSIQPWLQTGYGTAPDQSGKKRMDGADNGRFSDN